MRRCGERSRIAEVPAVRRRERSGDLDASSPQARAAYSHRRGKGGAPPYRVIRNHGNGARAGDLAAGSAE
jgi:hypothetical protein